MITAYTAAKAQALTDEQLAVALADVMENIRKELYLDDSWQRYTLLRTEQRARSAQAVR